MSPRHDCEICRGAGKVRLPISLRLMAAASLEMAPSEPVESSREYPCPECSDVVRLERVQAAREETLVASYIKEPRFIEHVQHVLAHQLAGFLLKHGYIKFERGPEDTQQMRFAMRATVGVVRPGQLDNLEERIAERQTEVAQEVVGEAQRQIDNWGSYYGHADILKRDAMRFVGEALQTVLKLRAKAWKLVRTP